MRHATDATSWMRLWIGVGLFTTVGLTAWAQVGTGDAAPAAMVETDPIRCWWKISKTAVHVGERFQLTLTCSIVDTADARVVVDESRLDPAAIQLVPFDIVGGLRHPDVEAGYRRFFQYEYVLRIIGDDLFGRDMSIPALDLPYHIESAARQAPALESLERGYRLPTLPVSVVALVSPQAADIRDAPVDTLAAIGRRRFHGNLAFAIAAAMFSGGLGMLAFAAGGVVRRYRGPGGRSIRALSEVRILRGALGRLQGVQQRALQDGWSDQLLGEVLAAIRPGLAIALNRPPSQKIVERDAAPQDGALLVTRGVVRPERFLVSASMTADGAALQNGGAHGRTSALADEFRSAVGAFTATRYGRTAAAPIELNRALEDAIELMKRLCSERSSTGRFSDSMGDAMKTLRGHAHRR